MNELERIKRIERILDDIIEEMDLTPYILKEDFEALRKQVETDSNEQ